MDEPTPSRIEDLIRERLRLDQELDRFQRLLTILYVDIVGSTRFYDEHGNAAGLVMVQKCLDLLMPIIESQRGIIVKTIGDAILARFDSVEDSIHGALKMVRTLEQRNRGRARTDEIHIHVGINYGPCLLKDNDVFGDVVNVAARIEGAAGVDEIVVSPSVYEQISQLPDIRVRKKSSGVELKGKAAKLDLYTVLWQEQESAGPAPPRPSTQQLEMATGFYNLAELTRRAIPPTPALPAEPVSIEEPTAKSVKFSLARVQPDGRLDHPKLLDRPGMTAGLEGDIALTGDPLVAPQHVRFTQIGDRVFVEDMGSPQGVYLRVRASHRLKPGDIIQMGQQLMRFELKDADSPDSPVMPSNKTAVFTIGSVPPDTPRALLVRLDSSGKEMDHCELRDAETIVGRSQGTYTFPNDPYLSSKHARVTRRDNRYILEDVGSTNGTFVQIRKRTFAQEGDTILIGKQLLRVLAERAVASSV